MSLVTTTPRSIMTPVIHKDSDLSINNQGQLCHSASYVGMINDECIYGCSLYVYIYVGVEIFIKTLNFRVKLYDFDSLKLDLAGKRCTSLFHFH